jgi:xanthine dehydrogenase accessory factor
MNNLSAILDAYQHNQENSDIAFLATVVHTKGSTYRRSGARMLSTDRSDAIGMVSGGCLEHDILCHIQQQTPPYYPFVITYDTTTNEDIVWGFGLGCDGVVRVLVEHLAIDRACHPLSFIADCFDRQQPGILVTVFQVEGIVPARIGTRLMLHSDGSIDSNLEDADLDRAIANDAQIALQQQRTSHQQYSFPSGQIEVLIELIQPPPSLVVFGTGRDVLPLAQFAKALGWHLTLVDCRSLETTRDRFPIADRIILTRRTAIGKQVAVAENTIAVVMTHNYHDDLAILNLLLSAPTQYIGVLGSRQRTERLLQELQQSGIDIPGQRHRLHAPIGLDIGAETPEEIAIAIIAEIQAVLTDRNAGFLKHRPTSIHLSDLPKVSVPLPHLTYATF